MARSKGLESPCHLFEDPDQKIGACFRMSRTYNKGSRMSRTKNIIDDYRFKWRMFYQNVQLLISGNTLRRQKKQSHLTLPVLWQLNMDNNKKGRAKRPCLSSPPIKYGFIFWMGQAGKPSPHTHISVPEWYRYLWYLIYHPRFFLPNPWLTSELFFEDFFAFLAVSQLAGNPLLGQTSRIRKLSPSISLICSSSKDEDNFLNGVCYLVSLLLSDSLS